MIKYNLSDILQIINKSFNKMFYDFDFRFKAEISRIRQVKSNIYLDMVETNEDGQIQAKMRWLIFKKEIWNKFIEQTDLQNFSQLKNYQILCHGKLNFHKQYWLGIVIKEISSEYVLGQLKANKQNIKQKLKKQNLRAQNLKTNIGYPPYKIAIISSQTSDWLKDFQSTLQNSQYQFQTQVFDTPVHWNKAKKQISNTLASIYKWLEKQKYNFDALAIVRWWGDSSGILRQNDFQIAKYISKIPIPIILAIWHTKDQHILDQLAKYPCKTPSDGAHFLIQKTAQRNQKLKETYQPIESILNTKLEKYKNNLDNTYEQIQLNIKQQIKNLKTSLQNIYQNIQSFDLEKMTQKWYAILLDKNNRPLSKTQIQNLQKGDKLKIQIYDQKIEVSID